jgi:hypothetical protein
VPAQRWISRSSAVTSGEVFWLGQSPVKTVIDWMSQFDGDRECAIQNTHWHQFFECFNDFAHSSCGGFCRHLVEYHEFPSCVGDFSDHQTGRDEMMVRSQQFFCPLGFCLTESTSARRRLRRRQLSFVELVVTAAPNGCSHIDIADWWSHCSKFFE